MASWKFVCPLAFLVSGVSACAGLWGFDPLAGSDGGGLTTDDGGLPEALAPEAPHDAGSGFGDPDGGGGCLGCDAAPPACGGRGQACCQNSACSQGLTCWTGSCTTNVLLFGGQNATIFLGDAWEWNGSTWSPVVHGPSARGWSMGTSFGGQAMIYGGYFATSVNAATGSNLNDVWTWDGVSWATLPNGPPERDDGSMATLGQQPVVFGGLGDTDNDLGDTWLFNGSAWSQWSGSSTPPPARLGAASATLGNTLVLFGGFTTAPDGGSVYFSDTWTFDGTTWTNATPASGPSPSARSSSWMVPFAGKLLLYGGDSGGNPFDDTWLWDGTSWTEVAVPGSGGRTSHAMATFGNTVVLFGGFDQNGNLSGDTWLYDGNAWSNPNAVGPPKRATHAMVSR